jgi:hypothetical protein
MSVPRILRVAALLVAIALGATSWFAWKQSRKEQAQLQADVMATQQTLAQANQGISGRNAGLQKVIATLEKKKATVYTPAQIMSDLPQELPLPKPMVADISGSAMLPKDDLKPLYNFAVVCQECQARLTAAQADLKDAQVKTQALGRERDTALQAAKGGSILRRIGRAAKWFAIGVAAGAIAARAAR